MIGMPDAIRLTGVLDPRDSWTAEACTIAKALEVLSTRSAFLILREAFYGTSSLRRLRRARRHQRACHRHPPARAGRAGTARTRGLSRARAAHPPALPPDPEGRRPVSRARGADAMGRSVARRARWTSAADAPRLRGARQRRRSLRGRARGHSGEIDLATRRRRRVPDGSPAQGGSGHRTAAPRPADAGAPVRRSDGVAIKDRRHRVRLVVAGSELTGER